MPQKSPQDTSGRSQETAKRISDASTDFAAAAASHASIPSAIASAASSTAAVAAFTASIVVPTASLSMLTIGDKQRSPGSKKMSAKSIEDEPVSPGSKKLQPPSEFASPSTTINNQNTMNANNATVFSTASNAAMPNNEPSPTSTAVTLPIDTNAAVAPAAHVNHHRFSHHMPTYANMDTSEEPGTVLDDYEYSSLSKPEQHALEMGGILYETASQDAKSETESMADETIDSSDFKEDD